MNTLKITIHISSKVATKFSKLNVVWFQNLQLNAKYNPLTVICILLEHPRKMK